MALSSLRGGQKFQENIKNFGGPHYFCPGKTFLRYLRVLILAEGTTYCLIYGKLSVNTHPIEFVEEFHSIILLSLCIPLAYFKGETWLFECQILSEQLSFYGSKTNVLK